MTDETDELRLWEPDRLRGLDPRGLSYIVVDEIEGGAVGLAVSEWPRLDEQGRVRFGAPALVGSDHAALQRFVDQHREESRLLRIGDVFAAHTRPVEADDEARLEPMLEPEEWIDPPLYDITPDARDAAKASFYGAVTTPMTPGEVELIDDLIERPPPQAQAAAPPSGPPRPRPWWRSPLGQIAGGIVLLGGGIAAGVGVAEAASSSERTVTEPGPVQIIEVNRTITIRETITNGTTNSTTESGPAQVEVPNVVRMSVSEARAALEQAQLKPNVSMEDSSAPKGTVFEQNPAPKTPVDVNSTVHLKVSSGQQPVVSEADLSD